MTHTVMTCVTHTALCDDVTHMALCDANYWKVREYRRSGVLVTLAAFPANHNMGLPPNLLSSTFHTPVSWTINISILLLWNEMSQVRALRLLNRYGYLEGLKVSSMVRVSLCLLGMDEIDISVSGQDLLNSSEIMQALTMFQSFYSKYCIHDW